MSGLGVKKRKQWIQQTFDKEVHYCSSYQQVYDPEVYEKQIEPLARGNISPYLDEARQDEAARVQARYDEASRQKSLRDRAMEESMPRNIRYGPDCANECHLQCAINRLDELGDSAHKYGQMEKPRPV